MALNVDGRPFVIIYVCTRVDTPINIYIYTHTHNDTCAHVGGQWSTINVCFVYQILVERQVPGRGGGSDGDPGKKLSGLSECLFVGEGVGKGSLDLWTSHLIPSVNVRPTDDGVVNGIAREIPIDVQNK